MRGFSRSAETSSWRPVRTVKLRCHLRRVGTVKDTIHTTELDTAYLQYRFLKKRFRQNRKRLPPEDRNAQRVQQAMECVRRAGEEVKQAGADTLKNRLETVLWFACAPLYYRLKGWN